MCILYCCEGRKLDNYWVITPPSLNKEYCIVLYCIVQHRRIRIYNKRLRCHAWETTHWGSQSTLVTFYEYHCKELLM